MDTVVHDVSDPTGPNSQNGPLHSDPTLAVSPENQNTAALSRAEIDTSAPFESVKEAATRFGGIGFWKPSSHKPSTTNSSQGAEEFDIVKVEEQAAQLEKDLIAKELETFDVLKQLETTKLVVEELKVKLQEASKLGDSLSVDSEAKLDVGFELAEKDGNENERKPGDSLDPDSETKKANAAFELGDKDNIEGKSGGSDMCIVSVPVLLELKQAKLNLSRTTNDLAEIRATVESYNKKIEKERVLLEKTRQRLSSNSSKVSSLEEELNQTKQKLKLVKDCGEDGSCGGYVDVTRELQRLSSETEQCKNVGEAAKSEVMRAMLEIEQTKTRIKTAEIRLFAAKKMKAAARASEAVALAEIKAFTSTKRKPEEGITLSFEEYSSLTSKTRDAEESCKRRVLDATVLVDEANVSTTEILKKVEEATEEVKTSKKALEEALSRVEAANRSKMEVEEALRKWRSERGQRRRSSIHNSTKFKNSSVSSQQRKDSQLFDVNGLTLVTDEAKPKPVLRSTLSIGQILSRKLQLAEEFESGILAEKSSGKRKVSLAQMLGKTNSSSLANSKDDKENAHKPQHPPAKRKKFGFSRISLLVTKQRKKKKQSPTFRCRSV